MAQNSNLRPQPFDGSKSQDVNDFIDAFERYAAFADWNDRKKARGLKTMLKDNAAKWLSRQNLADEVDYADLRQAIIDKYQLSQTQLFQMRTELTQISQKQGEAIDDFAERVEQLCNRLQVEDIDKTHHFIQGLQDSIKQHVLRMQPEDFDQARDAARAEEGASGLQVNDCGANVDIDLLAAALAKKLGGPLETAVAVKGVKSSNGGQPNQVPPPPVAPVVCQLCGQPRHIAPQCPSLHAYPQPPFFHAYPQLQPQLQQPRQRRQPRDRSTVQCFACGQFGHYRNECRDGQVQGNARGPAYQH